MPRRKRSSKRAGLALTLPRYLALTLGPYSTRAEDDRTLAACWAHHRERLLEDEATPWGFWRFEPGIPEELREEPPALYPLARGDAIRAAREALEARRAAWLLERDIEDIANIGA